MRAVRVLIDIGLHTQDMTLPESAELMVNKVLLSPELARAEVEAYPALPTQPMSLYHRAVRNITAQRRV